MNSTAVFWGLWKFALSLAALWFVVSIGLSTLDAINAHERREAAKQTNSLELFTPEPRGNRR